MDELHEQLYPIYIIFLILSIGALRLRNWNLQT